MRVAVNHVTRFRFAEPARHSIHDTRLVPRPAAGQRLVSWSVRGPGRRAEWRDGHGNTVTTFSVAQRHSEVAIAVEGVYEWVGDDSWLHYAEREPLPATFWLRNHGLGRHDARFDPLIADLVPRTTDTADHVPMLHELMRRVHDRITYKVGVSDVRTDALSAFDRGEGVCQDLAQIFVACCRRLGVPARYASGYLRTDDGNKVGSPCPAWAEALVTGLGWVGFDPANSASTTHDYLKLAVGLDYTEAAPVTGRRIGPGGEAEMTVEATVKRIG
ncbi:transglutaminase family protein [Reyranella sp. CPCC 100927]|uniref:transglutaminase family protein n=1 Tax=Reyranella sp. CPCC 100927 TaxID=2599616 RepID=UPI0011B63559|nr:transglutaminase family protein [Reyranella sp. CPCC 100927]TWS95827.1 transglutaminase family protein [Reyranella sp. CPCC 100927]